MKLVSPFIQDNKTYKKYNLDLEPFFIWKDWDWQNIKRWFRTLQGSFVAQSRSHKINVGNEPLDVTPLVAQVHLWIRTPYVRFITFCSLCSSVLSNPKYLLLARCWWSGGSKPCNITFFWPLLGFEISAHRGSSFLKNKVICQFGRSLCWWELRMMKAAGALENTGRWFDFNWSAIRVIINMET